MGSRKEQIDPEGFKIVVKTEGRDAELNLGLKERRGTSSCLGEKQKEQIYSQEKCIAHITYRCQFIRFFKG